MSSELRELIAAVTEQLAWLDTPESSKFSSEALMLQRADERVRKALDAYLAANKQEA